MPVTSKDNALRYNLKEFSYVGEYVKWVQWELCRVGYQESIDLCGGIDGQCGDGTVRCIAKFQAKVGLPERGICGKKTRKALKKA
jgi:peptidoglycan hydrolase-like protein with peptidoglycan-binding domain